MHRLLVTNLRPAGLVAKRAAWRLAALGVGLAAGAFAQNVPDYERPPLLYSQTEPQDAVAALRLRIASGELALGTGDKAALQTLLDALDVPVSSQLLVFSKTSLQRGRIRPEQPRAIYFSDSVYVGWVPGGLIEVAAVDPQLGPVFYTIETSRRADAPAPTPVRDPDCLRCHGGTFVRDIPGVFARSVFPSSSGEPLLRFGTTVVTDETPFSERWGGWYVTGYEGTAPHRGNSLASEQADELVFAPTHERPVVLDAFFPTGRYLARTSDVVALLVFEHQITVQNAITHAGMSARKMLAYQRSLQASLKEPITDEPAYDSVKSVFASATQSVLDRLLFRGAAALPDGVRGDAAFREEFLRRGPQTAAGRSLRDLQLRERLFVNRCSFLIYSDAFRALPSPLRDRILDQLRDALLSRDASDRYAYLEPEEKARILEILVETHPEAAARWGQRAGASQ